MPFSSRDDLIKQIPSLKRKHSSYAEYAKLKTPEELLDITQIREATLKKATQFRSGIMWNRGDGNYDFEAFPIEGQFSPLFDFAVFEAEDETKYVLGVGNFEGFRNDLGKAAAKPLVLMAIKNHEIHAFPLGLKGTQYAGFYRSAAVIRIKGESHIVAVRNNDVPLFLKTRF